MNQKQAMMLRQAVLDWTERELLSHGVSQLIVDGLKDEDNLMLRTGCRTWLAINGYEVAHFTNYSVLLHKGEELSRFIWEVRDE